MTKFAEIIDAFGAGHLAELLDLPESHIRVMKTRDSIPPEYWGVILDHLPEHLVGLDFHKLREIRTSRFSSSGESSSSHTVTGDAA